MPPSTQRRPRTRRVGSSPPGELPDSSPSRPRTKRRKIVEPLETVTPLSPQDQVNAVISSLTTPDDVAVAKQHANEKNYEQNTQGVTAYAKIAGSSWTYYVKDLVIRIGRPPDNRPNTAGSPTPPPTQKVDEVHIDLGPSKLISRNHAVISYDTSGGSNWQIQVIGRNGVKIDDETFKKDSKAVLRSGSVIEIGGVQMMFVLPNMPPMIAPAIIRRIRLHQYHVDEEVPLPPITPSVYESPPTPTLARPLSTQRLMQGSEHSDHGSQRNSRGSGATTGGSRSLMMDAPEDVDYSEDSMKEIKPPYSYALLIAQAILSSETEQLTLASIYQFILEKYAFYRHSNMGWQNSIRHNLSLNKAFRKIPRRTDEPGKGMKWELLPEHRDEYIKKLRKPAKSGEPRRPSQPGSPSSPRIGKAMPPGHVLTDLPSLPPPSRSVTPPPTSSYRVQQLEAYTPDRGSRLPALRSADKMLSDTPAQTGSSRPGTRSALASTNPDDPASTAASDTADITQISTVTPAPQRQHPRLAPPSASQLPSSYLPTSSPAPFWKYVQFGSTPAKPDAPDLGFSSPPPISPLKARSGGLPAPEEADDAEDGLGDFPGIDLTRGFEKIGKFHMNGRVSQAQHDDGWS